MAKIPFAPDAVDAWVSYLNPRISAPVGGKRAAGASFVRVRRVGGSPQTRITDNAQMVFECYAEDNAAADTLASHVRAHVFAAAGTRLDGGPSCKTVTNISAPAEMPDPETPTLSRYTFTVLTALKVRFAEPEQLRGTQEQ